MAQPPHPTGPSRTTKTSTHQPPGPSRTTKTSTHQPPQVEENQVWVQCEAPGCLKWRLLSQVILISRCIKFIGGPFGFVMLVDLCGRSSGERWRSEAELRAAVVLQYEP